MTKTFAFRLTNSSGTGLSDQDLTYISVSLVALDYRINVPGITLTPKHSGYGWWSFTLENSQIGSGIAGQILINQSGSPPVQGDNISVVIYANEEDGFSYIGSTRIQ